MQICHASHKHRKELVTSVDTPMHSYKIQHLRSLKNWRLLRRQFYLIVTRYNFLVALLDVG